VSSAPRRRRLNVVATSRFGCRFVKWVPWSRPGQCMAGGAQGGGHAPRPRAVRRVAPGPLTAPPAGGARAGKHLAGAGGRTARRKRRLAPRPRTRSGYSTSTCYQSTRGRGLGGAVLRDLLDRRDDPRPVRLLAVHEARHCACTPAMGPSVSATTRMASTSSSTSSCRGLRLHRRVGRRVVRPTRRLLPSSAVPGPLLVHQPHRRGPTRLGRLPDRLPLAVPAAPRVRAPRRSPTRPPVEADSLASSMRASPGTRRSRGVRSYGPSPPPATPAPFASTKASDSP
jgi:hypothetical protein